MIGSALSQSHLTNWIMSIEYVGWPSLPDNVDGLSKVLSSLDSYRSGLVHWLNICTFLVVVGVVVELVTAVFEHIQERKAFRKELAEWQERKTSRPRAPSLVFFVEVLGAVLVVVGVAGELRCEEKIGMIDDLMQRADNKRATLLQSEASDAVERAAKANERAAAANLARVELERKMQWRRLSSEQEKALCSALPPGIAAKTFVYTKDTDSESWQYALDFKAALTTCAPSMVNNRLLAYGEWPSPVPFGLWLRTTEYQNLAKSVSLVLERHGVKVAGIASKTENDHIFEILVGPLPPPPRQDQEP